MAADRDVHSGEGPGAPLSGYHEENLKRRARYAAVFVILAVLIFAMLVLNINTGSVSVSPLKILRVIFLGEGTRNEITIIRDIRLPRILMTVMLGGLLALAGFLLQTFFGISSGAKMVVALTIIFFIGNYGKVSSITLIAAAFAGALVVTGFILAISRRVRNTAALLIAGIMVGYICSAVTDFIITFADDSDIVNLHGWSLGSFSGMSWANVKAAAFITAVTFALTFIMAKPIGAYQLGEPYAKSMGVNTRLLRLVIILLSSVMSAAVTAYAGPVSFLGIAVPFLAKQALGTAKPVVVIPAAFLLGSVFCMVSDLIARTAFSPTELSISTVTSVIGAPIVIFMLLKKHRSGF